MKKSYQGKCAFMLMLVLALFTSAAVAQEQMPQTRAHAAPCFNYWSVGAFGGVMQFNGDLSKNILLNLYPESVGYNIGVVATKQFTRVIGLRARIAYGMVQSRVEGKFTWRYQDGSGTPGFVWQSFKSHIVETDIQVTVNWVNWIMGYKPDRFFSSYLIAGIGMDQSSGTKHDLEMNQDIAYLGRKGNELNVGNTSGMGNMALQFKAAVGLGFDLNINKHFSIPIEFVWRMQNSDLLDMTYGGAQQMVSDMYSSATIGLTYKFGYSCPEPPAELPPPVPAVIVTRPGVRFFVIAPRNIPAERIVRETFPIRNYVFFDLGSDRIPERYVLLTKEQVKDFTEDQLELYPPKNLSGRSDRQMVVYYNVLNILGERMVKNPTATIRLSGASMEGPDDGRAMAESIKHYLVTAFGIAAPRIITEGRIKPRIPSEQPGGSKELDLLQAGDRRVSILSASPELLMEFQTGEDAQLRSVEILATQDAPVDSYVYFNTAGGDTVFTSWSLEIKDDQGAKQNFGPYANDRVRMPGKNILGTRPKGRYKITMTGLGINGNIVKMDTTVDMVLWIPAKDIETTRFSVIYEFNESKAISIYDKYLTEIVVPKIPAGGTVVIHGYTDIIGEEVYNMKLSQERASDVRSILEKGLARTGRTDVTFEVFGFGEDPNVAPFDNRYPEERFYNRTVIIDIITKK